MEVDDALEVSEQQGKWRCRRARGISISQAGKCHLTMRHPVLRERPPMPSAHLLDNAIGAELPTLRTVADMVDFEATPYANRIKAQSTYDALRLGAAAQPQAAAIRMLSKADPDEAPITISHAEFIARVTQAANLFHELGVGPLDVVSLLLPLSPQAFFALFGAQATGIANPVNPMLSATQLAEIL